MLSRLREAKSSPPPSGIPQPARFFWHTRAGCRKGPPHGTSFLGWGSGSAAAAGGGGLFSVFSPRFLFACGLQEGPPHATSCAAAAAGWGARGGGEVVVSVSDGNSLFLFFRTKFEIRVSAGR